MLDLKPIDDDGTPFVEPWLICLSCYREKTKPMSEAEKAVLTNRRAVRRYARGR